MKERINCLLFIPLRDFMSFMTSVVVIIYMNRVKLIFVELSKKNTVNLELLG